VLLGKGTSGPGFNFRRLNVNLRTIVLTIAAVGIASAEPSGRVLAQGGAWQVAAPLPVARSHMAAATVGDIIYAVGGFDGGSLLQTLEAYNPATDTWTMRFPMPAARSHLAAAVVDGILYAVGGFDGNGQVATLEGYDPTTNMWATLPSMPTPRHSPAAAATGGILYVMGGYVGFDGPPNSGGWSAALEAYDPATNTWTTKAPMPTARGHFAAVALNGRIYAIGGVRDTPSNVVFATVEEYDPATDHWTTKAPMITARWAQATTTLNGFIYAIGGTTCNGDCPIASVEAYNPATNEWAGVAPLAAPRGWLAAGSAAGSIFAIGGSTCNFSGACQVATNEKFVATPVSNTGVGTGVPVDVPTTLPSGSSGTVSLTFDNVTGAGTTEVTTSSAGPPPPTGFKLTSPPVYYNITTTAAFAGNVRVCLNWSEGQVTNEDKVRLFQREGTTWIDITDPTSRNSVTNTLCGNATALSQFTLFEEKIPFTGFFTPIENGSTNAVKAGAAVPAKFSLGGNPGLNIFAAGYPRSQPMQCSSGDLIGVVTETVNAGSSSLSYDAATGRYTYVWKTEKSWANTCRELQVKLTDGEIYTARFTFR
jgi:N-acetylneuraminic acid mutarotase